MAKMKMKKVTLAALAAVVSRGFSDTNDLVAGKLGETAIYVTKMSLTDESGALVQQEISGKTPKVIDLLEAICNAIEIVD